MNCVESEQFFDAYLDGELSGSLRLEFDAHRLRCTICQQKLAMMEACEHILARDARVPELSSDFTDRVMEQVGQQRFVVQRARKRRIVVAAAVALQAAAVLVFAMLWFGPWNQAGEPDAVVSSDAKFIDDVDKALIDKDRVKLTELIFARRNQLAAARSTLRDDVSALARYGRSLSVLSDLTDQPDSAKPSLFEILFGSPAPPPAEETEPPTGARGPFSL